MRRALAFLLLFVAVSAPASITGRAVDKDGKSLAGARVHIFERETFESRRERMASSVARKELASTTTAADGAFSIDPKPHRAVDLVIDAPSRQSAAIEVVDGDDLGNVLVPPLRMRNGRVVSDGKPVANAIVSSNDVSVRTKDDGTFSILYSDTSLLVTHPDYAQTASSGFETGEIVLDRGVTVRGIVVATDGKTPVPQARIIIDGTARGVSRGDGTFSIDRVSSAWIYLVAVTNDLAAQVRHRDSSSLTVRLARAATFSGSVRTASGAPLADGIVTASTARTPFMRSTITDAKGAFTFTGLMPGEYMVDVRDPAFTLPQRMDVDLGAGPNARTFSVMEMPRLSGVVVNADGQPVPMALVGSREFAMRGRLTDESGRFTLRIRPGRAEMLAAQHRDYAATSFGPVNVAAGQTRSGLRIVLTPGFPFELRLVDRGGRAVPGEPVAVYSRLEDAGPGMPMLSPVLCAELDPAVCRVTSPSGTFSARLNQGTFDLTAGGAAFVQRRLRSQLITAKSSPMTIALDRGVGVSGRVVYADQTPVPAGMYFVSVRDASIGTLVGEGGLFAIRNVPAGVLSLSASQRDGGSAAGQSVEVKAPASNVMLTVQRPARLEGSVVVRDTKEPVREFSVSIVHMPGPFAQPQHVQSEDGRFGIEDVAPGTADVQVSAPGYATATVSKVAFEEAKTATVTVQVDRGGTVHGRVTAAGKPVPGVAVEISDPRRRASRSPNMMTDADGHYSIDGLAGGEYSLTFRAQSYAPARKTVEIEAGKDATLDAELQRGLQVTGRVIDAAGEPVANARIMGRIASPAPYGPPQAESDSEGKFTLDGLSETTLTVTATKSGYVTNTVNNVDPSSGQPLTLTLQRGGTITGRVLGLRDSELGLVRVNAFGRGTSASGYSDPAGNFTITGVPDGQVTVRAFVEGMRMRQSASRTVEVVNGSAAPVDLDFGAGFTVRGHVRRGGSPMAGVRVSLSGRGANVQSDTTDVDGSYEATVGAAGDYDVTVWAGSDSLPARRVTVAADMNYDIDLTGSTFRVRVVDGQANRPLPNAQLSLIPLQVITKSAGGGTISNSGPAGRPRSGLSDSEGQYVFDAVADGSYRVTAQKDQYTPESQTAAVSGGGEVTLTLRPADRLDLNVFDAADHRPVEGNVQVRDSANKGVPISAPMRDGNGAMHIWLEPGQYTVRVGASGYLWGTVQATVPGPPVQVALERGAKLVVTPVSRATTVRLVNPETRRPVAATSAQSGVFNAVAPGTYRLEAVNGEGLVLKQMMVVLVAGETTTVTMP